MCWSLWPLPPGTWWWCPGTTEAATGWSSPGPGGGGETDEENWVQFWSYVRVSVFVCFCVCMCLFGWDRNSMSGFKWTSAFGIFTSAVSSFPSASSLTFGTGVGVLISAFSSSGNVGSRDAFISQWWGGVMWMSLCLSPVCALDVSPTCDGGFFPPPLGRSAGWCFRLRGERKDWWEMEKNRKTDFV